MALFTVILDFDGGTYISQVRSTSVRSAVSKYASGLVANAGIPNIAAKRSLAAQLPDENPVNINDVQNVWICGAVVGRRCATIHIIQTAD